MSSFYSPTSILNLLITSEQKIFKNKFKIIRSSSKWQYRKSSSSIVIHITYMQSFLPFFHHCFYATSSLLSNKNFKVFKYQCSYGYHSILVYYWTLNLMPMTTSDLSTKHSSITATFVPGINYKRFKKLRPHSATDKTDFPLRPQTGSGRSSNNSH